MTMQELIAMALAEDLGNEGDITSQALIEEGQTAHYILQPREQGILAGLEIAEACFHQINKTLKWSAKKQNGDKINPNEPIAHIEGNAKSILAAERTALNFLCHLSGIATQTAKMVAAISGTKAIIRCTRKTTPLLRALEKQAVKLGGGTNHRFGLYDSILVKDNHIALAGSLDDITQRLQNKPFQIEVDSLQQYEKALQKGARLILLDNMTPEQIKQAVATRPEGVQLEASGGITERNITEIAKTGIDYIALGSLTHSVKALDIGLDSI